MMKKLAYLLAAAALCGCGNQAQKQATSTTAPIETTASDGPISPPPPSVVTASTKFFLGKMQDGHMETARVGDTVEHVFRVFPQPNSANASNDLPSEFKSGGYRGKGWDNLTSKPAEAFGVISHEDQCLLLMHQLNGTTQDGLDTQLNFAYENFGRPAQSEVQQGPISYWFWEDGGQRYMICAFNKGRGKIDATIVLGATATMDTLRMNKGAAQLDAKKAALEFKELSNKDEE